MIANRSRNTNPEIALRRAVHRLGLRYRVAYKPLPGIKWTADLVFPRVRLAVFLDGCFWHGCEQHCRLPASHREYWVDKIRRNRSRDASMDEQLRSASWTVIRIWEHEPVDAAAQRILAEMQVLQAPPRMPV